MPALPLGRGVALLALATITSCRPDPRLALTLPEGTPESAVLAVEEPGRLALYADRASSDLVFRVDLASDEARITVLLFRAPLSELGLDPGRIELLGPPAGGRTLPAFDLALRSDVVDGDVNPWRELTALDEPLASVRIPEMAPAKCAAIGGCYPSGMLPELACKLPCPRAPAPSTPAEPEEPAAPILRPCPGGWSEKPGAGGVTACAAPSLPARTSCPRGQAQFHPEGSCAAIGSPCPADDWPEALPAGRPTLFVDAGAAPGGDGSRAAPLDRISLAIDRASAGGVIALAKGDHRTDRTIEISRGISVVGACARDTRIVVTSAAVQETIAAGLGGGEVRDVTVIAGERGVTSDRPGEILRLDGVEVEGGVQGLLAYGGGHIEAHDVIVRGASFAACFVVAGGRLLIRRGVLVGPGGAGVGVGEPGSAAALFDVAIRDFSGAGIHVIDSATAAVSRARIEDLGWHAARAEDAGLSLSDVQIRGVRDALRETNGVHAVAGAHVELRRVAIEDTGGPALYAAGSSTSLSAEDLTIAGARAATADGVIAHGVLVYGAQVDIRRASIVDSQASGLENLGGRATLHDVLVRDSGVEPAGLPFGYGLSASEGGTLEIERVVVERSERAGLRVRDPGTRAFGRDLAVIGVGEVIIEDTGENGVLVEAGGGAELERVSVSRHYGVGLAVGQLGSTATISDVRLVDPRGEGIGVEVRSGARARLVRAAVEGGGARGSIITRDPGTSCSFEDLTVGSFSRRAVLVGESSEVRLRRAVIAGGAGIGIEALVRARLAGEDVTVQGIQRAGGAEGHGVAAGYGADLTLTDFEISRSGGAGLDLRERPAARLSRGLISRCAVGLLVAVVPEIELRALLDGVTVADNGIAVSTE